MRGFILTALFLAAGFSALPAATTIRDDTGGIVVFRKAGFDSLDKPIVFRRIEQDQAYFDIVTSSNLLVHIENDRVVKIVFFIDQNTFPTKFEPEDLAVLKARINELKSLASVSADAAKLSASHLKFLQNVYDVQSARYQQSAAIAAQTFSSEQEKAAFDKKCDLLWLALQASGDDLKHSEEIVAQMVPLATRSEMLTGVLAKWKLERNRALQLAGECRELWETAQKEHPGNFKAAADLKGIPDFPADLREKIGDLQGQLDQFRATATIPQTILYCKNEIPAVFLLNEMPKLVEKTKAAQYKEAAAISQKALQQVHEEQFADPYKPVYATFKNYSDLIEDVRTRFFRQLTKAQSSEGTLTDRETLAEYQKAYDIIPDEDIATKIEQLKAKIARQ